MMRKRAYRLMIISLSLFISVLYLKAQNIFSALENRDNATKATVKIQQDKRIEALVYGIKKHPVVQESATNESVVSGLDEENTKGVPGFRVQVYSSNAQKTAKTEAFRIEGELQQVCPDVPVYVTFHSPFWKVRAGNCRTITEAQQLKSEIGSAYPQVQKDLYVVHDEIKVPAK